MLGVGYDSAPMKYLLITIACLSFACSDGDSNTGQSDGPVDVRVTTDAGDAAMADRSDVAMDLVGDQLPDAAEAATPDLPAPAMLEITPTIHDFGTVAKDQTVTEHFTVKNVGGAMSGSLDIKLMNGTLDLDAFASVANGCDGALEPDATCDIEIRFFANVAGVHQGLLTATASPGGMASADLKATVP